MTILIDIAKKLRPKNAVKGDVLPQNHILNYVLRKIRLPVRILRFRENPYLQHFVIPLDVLIDNKFVRFIKNVFLTVFEFVKSTLFVVRVPRDDKWCNPLTLWREIPADSNCSD